MIATGKVRNGLRRFTLLMGMLVVTATLAGCAADLASEGDASATLTLQATGATAAAVAGVRATDHSSGPQSLSLGGRLALEALHLGTGVVALPPSDPTTNAPAFSGPHVLDLLGDVDHRTLTASGFPAGAYRGLHLHLQPEAGVAPDDPAAPWALHMVLTYTDAGGTTHRFILLGRDGADLDLDVDSGMMMHGGEHALVLALHLDAVFATPYGSGTLLDALLATPTDGNNVHRITSDDDPALFAGLLAALHDAMAFGEDADHDGHLGPDEDHTAGHAHPGSGGHMGGALLPGTL